jgi:hypothetical protein
MVEVSHGGMYFLLLGGDAAFVIQAHAGVYAGKSNDSMALARRWYKGTESAFTANLD